MLRIIAIVLFVVVGAYGYEAFSGQSIGVGRFVSSLGNGMSGAFAGGYGMALGATTSIGSALVGK